MSYRPPIHYTDTQIGLMWDRWQKGESLQQIAQLFDRNHSSIQRILAEMGGIRPAQRSRSRLALTLAEREEISRAVVAGRSMHSIATSLGRAPSSISREIERKSLRDSKLRLRSTYARKNRRPFCVACRASSIAEYSASEIRGCEGNVMPAAGV